MTSAAKSSFSCSLYIENNFKATSEFNVKLSLVNLYKSIAVGNTLLLVKSEYPKDLTFHKKKAPDPRRGNDLKYSGSGTRIALLCYFIKKLKTNKIADTIPSVICPVLNTLAFETLKSIKIPLQATSAKVSLNKRSTVIVYSSSV